MFINNSPKTLDARFGQGSAFALRVLHLQSVADPLPKARDSQQGNVENPTQRDCQNGKGTSLFCLHLKKLNVHATLEEDGNPFGVRDCQLVKELRHA